ncbi:hypothetical protein JTE90_007655 [Oedothorax gibbosus]|uniref:Uncharacterized protein n=1 Tax=Oedothorax gibbosus TaxID=931172 RepID=A0AAV6TSS7_9ARAC|nr:hypothetical protein JTE90_007655 [Oedothorax gibbosus]
MDKEFKVEYEELGTEVRDFTVQLLSQCRDTTETEMLLQLPWGFNEGGPKIQFPRVQLALGYNQREFVAHSLVQQVLAAHWLGEFRSWPRLSLASKMLHCFVRFLMLPFLSLALAVMPWFRPLKKYHSPLNRFLLHLVSYLIFLLMVFLLNHLDTGKFHKVPPQTGVEAEVLEDRQHKRKVLERKFWRGDDAALVHEALFSVGIVLAFGNLAYFYQQSSRLGPFLVSMSRMVLQSAYFMGFCLIVITTFAIAPTRMYEFYDGMKRNDKDGNSRTQLSTF